MITFTERPTFEQAWASTTFRIVMGGMGDDTAMMIAEMYKRGYEPDEIIFCDTGSEFPHTYKFIEHLKQWCEQRQWSKVVVLNKFDKSGKPLSLIEMVEKEKTLPAAAFGSKSCSMRFKTETADKYLNNHAGVMKALGITKKGSLLSSHKGQILRCVGINYDEPSRADKWKPEHKWIQVFPLYDWEIGEKESSAVEEVGLYYPGKSSCVMCPHLTGNEFRMLRDTYPQIFIRVLLIEKRYQMTQMTPESSTIGLCRRETIEMKLNSKTCNAFESQQCGECK